MWYCTGTELAEYYILRESLNIKIIDKFSFEFELEKTSHDISGVEISLIVPSAIKSITTPSNKEIITHKNVVTLLPTKGIYYFDFYGNEKRD